MHIDPVLNAAFSVLNGSMLLCLLIVITVGRRTLRRRSCRRKAVVTLLTDPRQCCEFFRHISRPCQGLILAAPEGWPSEGEPREAVRLRRIVITAILLIHLALAATALLILP
jgi:hypothetical protein